MNDESKIFNMSVRAFIALLITGTLCFMSLLDLKITEPMYTVVTFVLGYFFGQKTTQGVVK